MSGHFAWSTPPAPAAIALLQVPARAECFDTPLPAVGQLRFARLCDPQGQVIDEVVVARLDERTCEVGTHAGPGIRAAIEEALVGHGFTPGEPFEADVWRRLARATSPAAVGWWLLPEDERPTLPPGVLEREPVVLITGPANAGKSTLLNAWCGFRRALVADRAGTTRDLLSAETLVGGWRLRLLDSAGLRPAADPLERAGQDLVATARAMADCVLQLAPPDALDQPGDAGLVVLGKADQRTRPWPNGRLLWAAPDFVGASASADMLDTIGQAVLQAIGLPRLQDDGRFTRSHPS